MTDLKIKYIGWNMGQYGTERHETKGDIEIIELTIGDVDVLKELKKLEAVMAWYQAQLGNEVDPQDIFELSKILECQIRREN